MAHEPRCGRPLCMTSSVVQVKQNVSEAGSGFSNRESVFVRNIVGCVYIFVATLEDRRKGDRLKFCASPVHQTMDEVEKKCVFEEKKSISCLYHVVVSSQYSVRFFSFALCCTSRSIKRFCVKYLAYNSNTQPPPQSVYIVMILVAIFLHVTYTWELNLACHCRFHLFKMAVCYCSLPNFDTVSKFLHFFCSFLIVAFMRLLSGVTCHYKRCFIGDLVLPATLVCLPSSLC